MTTRVQAWVGTDAPAVAARRRLRRVFARVEARLTRFRDASELNRFCAVGAGPVSPMLFRALTTAGRAWRRTGGLFDPRVRAALEALGYGPQLRFGGPPPALAHQGAWRRRNVPAGPWMAVGAGGSVLEGYRRRTLALARTCALDLGGIGKGLALRYAARGLRGLCAGRDGRGRTLGPCGPGARPRPGFLVDAGGDIWAEGRGPDGTGWRLGIPAPGDAGRALAVLRVAGRAVCTSSRARRQWAVGGRPAHHLIDPRTGRPADDALLSVTVVGRDPAWAEVWSKTLFVAGAAAGPALAERRQLAAVFCAPDGGLAVTGACRRYLEPGGAE